MKLLLVLVALALLAAALVGAGAPRAALAAADDAGATDGDGGGDDDKAAAAAASGGMFTPEQQAALDASKEQHAFGSDVSKLMHIIVHSVYTKPEVFLRELVSNAADALDKIRFLSLTDKAALGDNADLKIEIRGDPEANTLTIRDFGVGMTRKDLTDALGTIARSGTKEFVQKFAEYSDSNLIGQFGVGFYSVFLVAESVTVVSKNNDDAQHVWQSAADGAFTVSEDPRGDTLGRGTEITLTLKEDAAEYAKVETLKNLVSKYSEFITFPIYVWASHEETNDVALSDDEIAAEREKLVEQKRKELADDKDADADEDEVDLDDDAEKKDDDADKDADEDADIEIDEDEVPKTKSVTETVWAWERVNDVKPLWTRSNKDVKRSEYVEFYKSALKDYTDPVHWTHFAAEGEIEFKALLYVPGAPPSGMFEGGKRENLKLYVRRVFITDDFTEIMPKYLSFLKGIVDSDDLPLNVSREQLQQSKVLKLIKKRLVRKAIAMFQQLKQDQLKAIEERDREEEEGADKDKDEDEDADAAADKDEDENEDDDAKPTIDVYDKFYENFATNLKLGVIEDAANRARLSKLLKFETSHGGTAFLEDYVKRMKDGQTDIYYLGGESKEAIQSSPLLERVTRRGFEVLYMVDPIDEYCLQHLSNFDGKHKLVNVGKEGVKLPGEKEMSDEEKEKFDRLLTWFKLRLSDKVEKAVLSQRLTTSPSAIVTSQWGYSARQEQVIRAQALGDPSSKQGFMMNSKRTLELNPTSPIVRSLNDLVAADENDDRAVRIAEVLYDSALLTSGFPVGDTGAFASRINRLLADSLELDDANPTEEELAEMDPDEEEDEEEDEEDEEEEDKDEL